MVKMVFEIICIFTAAKTLSVAWQTLLLHLIIEYLKRSSLIAPCNQHTAHPPKSSPIQLNIHTFHTEMKFGHFKIGPTNFKTI